MMCRIIILVIALTVFTSACALSDLPTTPPPVLTFAAPPTLVFTGSCAVNPELEAWLQRTSFLKSDFLVLVEETASLSKSAMHDNIVRMANKRDSASAIPIPDCAAEAHLILVDVMKKAVETFQAYNNSDIKELGNILAETQARMEIVSVIQLELTDRLESQYDNPQN